MTTTREAAGQEARRNYEANRSALGQTQPNVDCGGSGGVVEYVYARDGSLSGLDGEGRFLGECSLPRRAARELLRKMTPPASTSCFLAPTHGAQIEVALEAADSRAIVVILPDAAVLGPMLHCVDLSGWILSHRLFFVTGVNWPGELLTLFRLHPGLPLPQCFLKTAELGEEKSAAMMSMSQGVFGQLSQERAQLREQILSQSAGGPEAVCLLARSRFRLWDDGGQIMAELLSGEGFRRVDPDDPCSAGVLALALAVRDCGVLVAVNATRAEVGEALPARVPMVSWMTIPAIPRFTGDMSRDVLLLADGSWVAAAKDLGWPGRQLAAAGWPAVGVGEGPSVEGLAIIADTVDVSESPAFDLSSHRLLWETIAGELRENPFAVIAGVDRYLGSRMGELGIGPESVDRRLFVDSLIQSAYAQALARRLIGAGLPVRIYGRGWGEIREFSGHFVSEIGSRAELLEAVARSRGLVHVWPTAYSHPISSLGRAVVMPHPSPSSFVTAARGMLEGSSSRVCETKGLLTAELVKWAIATATGL